MKGKSNCGRSESPKKSPTKIVDLSESSNEEDEDCRDCKTTLTNGDQAVQCDSCSNWYCIRCTKISAKTYQALTSSKDDGVMWLCSHCRISMPGFSKLVNRLGKLENSHKQLMEDIQKIKNTEPIDRQTNENSVTKEYVENSIQDALTEQRLREEKKKNIMIFGLKESTKPLEERKADDISCVNKIIKDVMGDDAVVVDRLVRVGRFDPEQGAGNSDGNSRPKARPIKIFMPDLDSKMRVLNALRLMVNNDRQGRFKYMYCQPDLTIKQRVEARKRYQDRANTQATYRGMPNSSTAHAHSGFRQ